MSLIRTTATRRRVAAASLLGAALVLSGCATSGPTTTPSATSTGSPAAAATGSAAEVLADHGLAGLDIVQIIERLDTMPRAERPADLKASVRPDQVIFTDAQQRQSSLPIPADQFYVSFAPYVNQTHECHFHSLTTCVGELQNADIQVKVTNSATGEVLVDQELRTYDNGFLGLWLPRDIDAELAVRQGERTASVPMTTKGDDAATCLTTLKLV